MTAEQFSRWRPHPWHGLAAGPDPPRIVHAYVEITPYDAGVKYEIDKTTGYLKVDRPQRTSSQPPTPYGFIPQTFCGPRVAELMGTERADGDPLDVCIVSERPIGRGEILLDARVLGGLKMIDRGEADDKIVAVLVNDLFWDAARSIEDLPAMLVERLMHYFTTYKNPPGEPRKATVEGTYALDHALDVVRAALADYAERYGRSGQEDQ